MGAGAAYKVLIKDVWLQSNKFNISDIDEYEEDQEAIVTCNIPITCSIAAEDYYESTDWFSDVKARLVAITVDTYYKKDDESLEDYVSECIDYGHFEGECTIYGGNGGWTYTYFDGVIEVYPAKSYEGSAVVGFTVEIDDDDYDVISEINSTLSGDF